MRLTIDGRNVEAAEGMSILQAAKTVGIEIPTLCYLEGISDIGSCRLCVVEVEGKNELATACNTKAKEGMVVQTASERVIEARKTVLKLLLSNHNIDCFNCEKNGDCELQKYCNIYGIDTTPYFGSRGLLECEIPKKDAHPFLSYDQSKCIYCQRCVQTGRVATGRRAIKLRRTGKFTIIDAPFGDDWEETRCESCGNCAQACPTGALTIKRRKN